MGYIYKITNKINHKIYVGLTTKTVENRWKEHIKTAFSNTSDDRNSLFKKAIRKYGVNNWIIETIDSANDIEELKQKEKYWIKTLNSYAFADNSWGYNSTLGGDGVVGYNDIPVVQCDIITGTILKEYRSTIEAQKAIGVRVEKIGQKNCSCGGFCFLYKDKIKNLSEEDIKNKVHELYPYLVYQIDLNGNIINIFRNTTEASKNTQVSQGNLISCCNGTRRQAGGFQWSYQKDINTKLNKPAKELELGTKVTQYGMNGKKIKEWKNISEIKNVLGISDAHISACCKGNRQIAGQFQWRYSSDNIEELPEIFNKRPVICIETGEEFETCNNAAKFFGYSMTTVKKNCMGEKINKPYHFKWKEC